MSAPDVIDELNEMGFREIVREHVGSIRSAENPTTGALHTLGCVVPGDLQGWNVGYTPAHLLWDTECAACRLTFKGSLRAFLDVGQLLEKFEAVRTYEVQALTLDETAVSALLAWRLELHASSMFSTAFVQQVLARLDAAIETGAGPLSARRTALLEAAHGRRDGSTMQTLITFPHDEGRRITASLRDVDIVTLSFVPRHGNAILVPDYAARSIVFALIATYPAYNERNVQSAPCESVDLAQHALTLHQEGGAFRDLNTAVATARDAF